MAGVLVLAQRHVFLTRNSNNRLQLLTLCPRWEQNTTNPNVLPPVGETDAPIRNCTVVRVQYAQNINIQQQQN